MSQLETWVKEIHTDVRELRGEVTELRGTVLDNHKLESRVAQLEEDKREYELNRARRIQVRIAFAAPMTAAVIGSVIAVAPHLP